MGNLILSRRSGESVKIGNDTVLHVRDVFAKKIYIANFRYVELGETFSFGGALVTVSAIAKGIVKLAFNAERSLKIVRSELL